MGIVYYGNYAQYFEIGRVESLRSLGMSYRKMEEDGNVDGDENEGRSSG